MSCHKCHKEMKLGDKVKIICTDCYEQIADLEAKLAESDAYKLRIELAGADETISQLKQQLAEKDKAIETWQTMYKSVVQTCYNDKEEIERLNKRLETQENTITNLVEDNRASQEWYKKQLEEKDYEISFWKKHHRSIKKSSNKIFRQAGIAHIQDKISFCIEKLVNIQRYISDNPVGIEQECFGREINEFIDNQIKQLKEEK